MYAFRVFSQSIDSSANNAKPYLHQSAPLSQVPDKMRAITPIAMLESLNQPTQVVMHHIIETMQPDAA
jgi:hypothetical protein